MAPDPASPETEPLWTFVAPEAIALPTSLVDARVQEGVSALQAWIRRLPVALSRWWTRVEEGAHGAETADVPSENGPQPASDVLLERIAPAPDWSEAVAALNAALEPWMERPDGEPALVLDPWYHGAPSIVRRWAAARGWAIVEPPPRDDIAPPDATTADWLAARAQDGTPWVLPRLERCHLRTPRGLVFVRRLLDRWAEGALGRGLIGCDPHAWTYLRHVWPGQIPNRLTLQAFSAGALARWFRTLAEAGRPDEAAPISFRMPGEDDPVIPERREVANEGDPAPPSDDMPTSAYLRGLAVYSQGHPGIAWTLWRQSLLVPPDADETSNRESELEQTIWVRPWSDVEHPRRPSDFAQLNAFVLHALLLHGGLSADQLSPLLPTDRYAVRHRLQGLSAAGFVVQEDATWQLTPAGYPAACDILRREAYLPDPYDT